MTYVPLYSLHRAIPQLYTYGRDILSIISTNFYCDL